MSEINITITNKVTVVSAKGFEGYADETLECPMDGVLCRTMYGIPPILDEIVGMTFSRMANKIGKTEKEKIDKFNELATEAGINCVRGV